MEEEKKEYKIIFVGNSNVGKTSISTRYVNGEFSDSMEPTVGAAYLTKEVEIMEKKCTFNIWDTAGQETYRYLVPMYYRNANVAVVVFDLTSATSFQAVPDWIDDIQKNVGDNVSIIVCGNKSDCENREVEYEEIHQLVTNFHSVYVEVSALTGANIENIFEMAFVQCQKLENMDSNTEKSLDLNEEKKKGGCC